MDQEARPWAPPWGTKCRSQGTQTAHILPSQTAQARGTLPERSPIAIARPATPANPPCRTHFSFPDAVQGRPSQSSSFATKITQNYCVLQSFWQVGCIPSAVLFLPKTGVSAYRSLALPTTFALASFAAGHWLLEAVMRPFFQRKRGSVLDSICSLPANPRRDGLGGRFFAHLAFVPHYHSLRHNLFFRASCPPGPRSVSFGSLGGASRQQWLVLCASFSWVPGSDSPFMSFHVSTSLRHAIP